MKLYLIELTPTPLHAFLLSFLRFMLDSSVFGQPDVDGDEISLGTYNDSC